MYIVPTKLAKPHPPWLLVAMSHICKCQNKELSHLGLKKYKTLPSNCNIPISYTGNITHP